MTATASSGLTVTYTSATTGVCTVSGSTVTLVTTGTCTINANQAGNANYNAAAQVPQSFTVTPASQTITFTAIPDTVYGNTVNLTATASSSLTVTYTSATTGVCTVSGSTVTLVTTGTCTINANQAGNANYNAAAQVPQSFTVTPASQTITFTSTAPAATVGGATYTPTATGGASGNTVTFSIDNSSSAVCSISGGAVSFLTVGTCTINANQAGNTNYNAATQVQQAVTVGSGSQTINFPAIPDTVYGNTVNLTATASSGLTVTYTSATTGVCTVSGSTVTLVTTGTCTINANQAGNANYNAAAQVPQSFTVIPAGQTITFTSTAPFAPTTGTTYTPTAISTSGLTVDITIDPLSSLVCSISAGLVTFDNPGTCTINANQAGNANYNAAPQVIQVLSIPAVRASSPEHDFTNGAINSSTWDNATISPAHLTSISCPSTSFCMAIDTEGSAFHYDGKNWSAAEMIGSGHPLKSVSCASSSSCVAVDTSGYAFVYNDNWGMGSQFDTSGEPVSVSCPSSSFCMVVDNNANAFVYNGKTWSDSESVGIASKLTAVSCTSDSECIAVDAEGNGSRYNGTEWTAYSANPISANSLTSVSCTPNSGSFCMAVDNAGNAFDFDGTSWTPQYDDGAIDSEPLNSVSCLGSAFCMVVDNHGGVLRYNGATWSAVSDIDGNDSMTSLSCPTTSFCMGVDHAGNAWEYRATAANITLPNPGNKTDADAPITQSFSITKHGNAASMHKITGLSQPEAAYIDTNNNLWIADSEAGKVYRFPASAQGAINDDLQASIVITNDANASPSAVVTDSSGNIYVADHNDALFIYPASEYQTPGTYDDASPSTVISGERTGLHTPQALALDSDKNIWVANQSGNSIAKFAAQQPEDDSNVAPAATIKGSRTLLDEPNGVAIDAKGNIWVTNAKVDEIYVFKAGSTGNIAPSCIIRSDAIHSPSGITVDANGNIYQVNDAEFGGAINIFAPISATCDTTTVTPARSIAGANTSIGRALGLSIGYVF